MRRLIATTLLALILTGCAMSQRDIAWANYDAAFQKYNASVVNADGQLTKSKFDYYSDLSQIAYQNNQRQHEHLWWMLGTEAGLQEAGQPNRLDSLETRLNASDQSLFLEAESYRLNIAFQKKCQSFGYGVGSPDFNKCVHDLKVQFVQNRQAIRQQIWSMPLSSPSFSTTKCINTAFGINCNTTGF